VEKHVTEPILRWLKKAAKSGLQLGSTCTGSYVLAKAGVLDGYRCSIHWENIASLTDMFPKVQVRRSIYTIDRDRLTSSGGTTPIDMMLYLVRRQLRESRSNSFTSVSVTRMTCSVFRCGTSLAGSR
jgi:transcriptional regulator GlxA family with amidase domain